MMDIFLYVLIAIVCLVGFSLLEIKHDKDIAKKTADEIERRQQLKDE